MMSYGYETYFTMHFKLKLLVRLGLVSYCFSINTVKVCISA